MNWLEENQAEEGGRQKESRDGGVVCIQSKCIHYKRVWKWHCETDRFVQSTWTGKEQV